jgi:hypothetical protein
MQVLKQKDPKKINLERLELLFNSSRCTKHRKYWQKALGKDASPKDKRGTIFCCGFQRLTDDGKCPICLHLYKRQSTFDVASKRFDLILQQNQNLLNEKFGSNETLATIKELIANANDSNSFATIEKLQKLIRKLPHTDTLINIKEINVQMPFPLGKKLYFIPFSFIVEYFNISTCENSQLQQFFEYVLNNCVSYDL